MKNFRRTIAGLLLGAAGAVGVPATAHAYVACRSCLTEGNVITFMRDSGDSGRQDVYTMAADGSGATRLTTAPGYDGQPSWAPNRSKIVFASNRQATGWNPEFELYSMNPDGTNQTPLTASAGQNWEPSWSPAGNKIAFTSTRDGQSEIYTINSDGTGLARLTVNNAFDNQPQFSPDGTHIVFASNRNSQYRNLYVMDANGSNVRQLTNIADDDYNPAWSKDGTKIAFSRDAGGNQDIFWVDANTNPYQQRLYRVTSNGNWDGRPTWTPDGRIAFGSVNASGDTNILVANQDGTGVTSLTNSSAKEDEPNWAAAQQYTKSQ